MNLHTDDLIEDALRTYPLADVPPNFSKNVMRRVNATANPAPRFRLTWMDYALGFFLTLLPAVGFVIWASLPRLAVLHLEFQWQVLQASGFLPVLAFSLAVAGVLLFSGLLFSMNLFLRPKFLA
jgi:hypothetical protein